MSASSDIANRIPEQGLEALLEILGPTRIASFLDTRRHLDASLKPAEMEGKEKAWFEKNWGAPSGKAPRFFGGEEWTYFRIAGGKSGAPFFNFAPNQCQITLKFDKEEKLNSYKYSGC